MAIGSIVAGSLLRVVWILLVHPPADYVFSDMQGYVQRARALAAGAKLMRFDTYYPPGTHLLLAVPLKLHLGMWGGAVLWCALSCLVPLLMWRLAQQLLTPKAAAITAVLCSFWPLYITYGGYFTSETPSLAFLLGALWLTYRAWRAAGRAALAWGLLAGLLGGMAITMRPQVALNLLLVVVPLVLRFRQQALALVGIVAGALLPIAGVVLLNSAAAGKPTGISENSGQVFYQGHCDIHVVTMVDKPSGSTYYFLSPVDYALRRGKDYYFDNHFFWDQSFMFAQGWACIRRDGLGHIRRLLRNVVDMTATTVPWPQSVSAFTGRNALAKHERELVETANFAYAVLLPWVVIETIVLIRRRRVAGWWLGETVLLAQLACVVPMAILFVGDPRYRSTYDVFGLALLASLLVGRVQPVREGER